MIEQVNNICLKWQKQVDVDFDLDDWHNDVDTLTEIANTCENIWVTAFTIEFKSRVTCGSEDLDKKLEQVRESLLESIELF